LQEFTLKYLVSQQALQPGVFTFQVFSVLWGYRPSCRCIAFSNCIVSLLSRRRIERSLHSSALVLPSYLARGGVERFVLGFGETVSTLEFSSRPGYPFEGTSKLK